MEQSREARSHRFDVELEHFFHVRGDLGQIHVVRVVAARVRNYDGPERNGREYGLPGGFDVLKRRVIEYAASEWCALHLHLPHPQDTQICLYKHLSSAWSRNEH